MNLIERNPIGAVTHTVICMHGLGANGHDLAPLATSLQLPGVRFVFPSAPEIPVTLNQGYVMPAWYDIRGLDFSSELRADHAGVDAACDSIKSLMADEQSRFGLTPDKIFLMGFSQGGSIALELGLHYPKRIAGIIGLSTLPPKAKKTFENLSPENKSCPVFLAHGREDAVVPYHVGEFCQSHLEQQGYVVSWHSYSMGHEICKEELLQLRKWFHERL